MAAEPPDRPKKPEITTPPSSLVGDVASSIAGASQTLQTAANAVATGSDVASQVMDKVRKRVEFLQTLSYAPRKAYEIGSGILQAVRGIGGLIGSTFVGMAAAVAGIPASGASQLCYGFTENFPFTTASRELFASRWKQLRKEAKEAAEQGKGMKWYDRVFQFLASPVVTGLGSGAVTCAKDIAQAFSTGWNGTGNLQEQLKKLEEYQTLTSAFPIIDKFFSIGSSIESMSKMVVNFLANAKTTNALGAMANWIYKKASESETIRKLFSESTLKKLDTFGKAAVGFFGGTVNKEALVAAAKDVAQDAGSDLIKRMGVSEQTLANLQAKRQELEQRLQNGDYAGAATSAFQTFGFDIKKITGGQDLMKVAAQVQNTFAQAITQFTDVQKYLPGKDFETVKVGVTKLLGFQGDALTKFQDGIKKTLGAKGEEALGQTFQTIRAKGDNMVNAAKDFVENLKKTNPKLGDQMGFTMAAGNLEDAMKALLAQKAAPDFIEKIHTFNIVDTAGQVLRNLTGTELDKFKQEAMQMAAELLPPIPPMPDSVATPAANITRPSSTA